MPRDVTRNCSNGIAFAVGDHVANDALLGQGAYAAGHRATELIPGTDRGTALVKGFTGERSEIVQVYFLAVDHDHDQVTPIIERSLAQIAGRAARCRAPVAAGPPSRCGTCWPTLTTCSAPSAWGSRRGGPAARSCAGVTAYRHMTATGLRDDLADAGVRTVNTSGVIHLDPADLRRALADR